LYPREAARQQCPHNAQLVIIGVGTRPVLPEYHGPAGRTAVEAHVVMTAGLPAEPLPLPPGHSEEQREAEGVMLELLSARLGVNLQPRLIHLPSGVRLEVDGACDDPPYSARPGRIKEPLSPPSGTR
jgi:hypothetical protein